MGRLHIYLQWKHGNWYDVCLTCLHVIWPNTAISIRLQTFHLKMWFCVTLLWWVQKTSHILYKHFTNLKLKIIHSNCNIQDLEWKVHSNKDNQDQFGPVVLEVALMLWWIVRILTFPCKSIVSVQRHNVTYHVVYKLYMCFHGCTFQSIFHFQIKSLLTTA